MALIRKALVPGTRIYTITAGENVYATMQEGGTFTTDAGAIFTDFAALSLALTGKGDWPWLRFYVAGDAPAKPVRGSQTAARALRAAQPKPALRTAEQLLSDADYGVLARLRDPQTSFLSPTRRQDLAPAGETGWFCSACMAGFYSPLAPEGRGKAPEALRCPAGHDRTGYRADEQPDVVLDTPPAASAPPEVAEEPETEETAPEDVPATVRRIVRGLANPAQTDGERKPRARRVKAQQPA